MCAAASEQKYRQSVKFQYLPRERFFSSSPGTERKEKEMSSFGRRLTCIASCSSIHGNNSLEATDHGAKRGEKKREAVRQLPPEITQINLDGPPSKSTNQTWRLREPNSSPNEIARESPFIQDHVRPYHRLNSLRTEKSLDLRRSQDTQIWNSK